ncbi:hypothetical protein [Yunchengibacter salinarum]|uniref:hypothetical protein n=1 Tax=Yunchengibacter salinarum TaxID=3133399 RepID=UPI0035B61C12
MSDFLHRLAQELRGREQHLEDHNTHPAFEPDRQENLRQQYENLLQELQQLSSRIEAALKEGGQVDEHFEKEIAERGHSLKVEVDAFVDGMKK